MKQYDVNTVQLQNGETIAYRKAGSADGVVLLIHGNMSSSVHFQPAMAELEADYTVYAPDLRGLGDSSYNKPFDSLAELAQDIAEFLGIVGIKSCAVVGWSTGGGVAMELAALLPDVVTAVVKIASVSVTGYPLFKKDANGAPMMDSPMQTKEDVQADVMTQYVAGLLASGDKATLKGIYDAAIYNESSLTDEEYDLYMDATFKQRCIADVYHALLTFRFDKRIDEIKCPITMLHGTKDAVVPYEMGQASHAHFGDKAKFITFEGCGHGIMTDKPAEFYAALRKAFA